MNDIVICLKSYKEIDKSEELIVETHCDKCNNTISGKRGYIKCPSCGEINTYIRILETYKED